MAACFECEDHDLSYTPLSSLPFKAKLCFADTYLCRFEHQLSRIIKKSKGSFGQSMGSHKNSREFHICFPWIYDVLYSEALEINKNQVHETLYKSEIPSIAAKKMKTTNPGKGKPLLKFYPRNQSTE